MILILSNPLKPRNPPYINCPVGYGMENLLSGIHTLAIPPPTLRLSVIKPKPTCGNLIVEDDHETHEIHEKKGKKE
jgi:hypothetical protein